MEKKNINSVFKYDVPVNKNKQTKLGGMSGNTRKHKSQQQEDIFLEFMEKNSDIAKGFVKSDRVVADKKWQDLTVSLNSVGPPIKDIAGWKKVWSDWKISIRKKLSHNKRETKATGGGPYNQLVLSAAEERISQICGLHVMVDGISGAKVFCGNN
ncbi:uncharacterized protein LOC142235395 [Haematobia irritans]|uniref:uncharacterized protein LOC142235395 n=1 Tax=Haematobia irritans TaxID=7368 RepID=UPI003F503AE0